MRILVLNYEFPPVGGGGGRASEVLCRHLVRLGHEMRVLTAHVKGLPRIESRDGFTIHRTRGLRRYAHTCTVPEMAAFLLTSLIPAWRLVVNWKPQVMHVHFAVPTGVLAWVLHRATHIPYVLSAHLGDVPGAMPDQTDHLFRWLKPLTQPIWQEAAAVTVPSEHVRQLALRSYQVPIELAPNGVDLSGFAPNLPDPHQPVRLIFAGRFNPQKNLLFLIGVLEKLADLEWRLDMLGDGPLREKLVEKVRQAGLHPRVHFHGWVKPEAVKEIMSQGDVLLLPSRSEGLPVAGVQALGAGLAIMGSRIGGLRDLVIDGLNGYLAPDDDAQAFAGGLREMLTDRVRLKEMKQISREMASKFDINAIARRFNQIFSQIGQ